MPVYSTRCPWCGKGYSKAGAYANHLIKKDPDAPKSTPFELWTDRRISTTTSMIANTDETTFIDIFEDIYTAECLEISDEHSQMSDEEPPPQDVLNAHQNTSIASPTIEEYPPNRQAGCPIASVPAVVCRKPNYNPLFAFSNHVEYKLARFFTSAKVLRTILNFYKSVILLTAAPGGS